MEHAGSGANPPSSSCGPLLDAAPLPSPQRPLGRGSRPAPSGRLPGGGAPLRLPSRGLPFDLGIEGLTLSAGPTLGSGDLSEVSVGLTVSAQHHSPAGFGNTVLQPSYDSINQSHFVQTQIGFKEPGLSLALARRASTEHEETSLRISRRLGDSPFGIQAGYRFVAESWFVGISVNTF